MKDEALKLALAAIESEGWCDTEIVINAIKQALAAQPAPVQEPVALMVHLYNFGYKAGHHDTVEGQYIDICRQDMETYHLEDVSEWLQDMAQRQCNWPTCQSEEYQQSLAEQIKQELVTGAAQPAVPDAMTSADIQESIEYVAGWNDCRQAMLEMMK